MPDEPFYIGEETTPPIVADVAAPAPVPPPPLIILGDQPPAEPQPRQLPQPGFWQGVGLILVFFAIQVAIAVVVMIALTATQQPMSPRLLVLLNAVAIVISAVCMTLAGFGARARRALAIRGIHPLHLLVLVAMVLPLAVVNLSCSAWLIEMVDAAQASAQEAELPADSDVPLDEIAEASAESPFPFSSDDSPFEQLNSMYAEMASASWPVLLIFFCLFPALGEELFFRGILGRGYAARFAIGGVVITSLAFGLSHLDPVRVMATTALGLVLHAVYLLTRSLLAPMLLHFLNNALVFSAYKAMEHFDYDPTGISRFDVETPSILLGLTAVAAVLALSAVLHQAQTRWRLPDGTLWEPGYLTAEMPPKELAARPVVAWPRWWSILAAVGTLAAFAPVYYFG